MIEDLLVLYSKDGLIGYEEFCKGLGIKDTKYARKFFELLDLDGTSSLDFREFVFGLYIFVHLNKDQSLDETHKMIESLLEVFGLA